MSDPTNELHQRIFYISSWSNSPEVEISLGLDGRSSHKYSFYEIIDGFKNNQELLDNLKLKSSENYTYVEQQIVDIYSKVVLLDEIAHSFTCLLPKINIVNQEIRDALKLKSDVLLSYSFFVNNIFLFSPLMEELLKIDPTLWTEKHRELNDIAIELHQIGQYQYAKALKVIPPNINDADKEWLSPWEIMSKDKINKNQTLLITHLEGFFNHSIDNNFSDYSNYLSQINNSPNINILTKEVNNNKIKYFHKSLILYLFAIIILGISWVTKPEILRKISLFLMSSGFILHTIGIINRMIIMKRPPVTTLYESIIFVCFVLVLISIIIELMRKNSLGLFIGLTGGIILHYIGLKYAADGDTLGMLVAVLNSNFWLSIHVTTITFGYGVSLVAGLMGHVYLLKALSNKTEKKALKIIYNNTYGMVLIALFFTLFGTILGGIWADQSWGRFWGWDPKENGALLIVMWHLMLLHLRISGIVKPLGFVFWTSFVNIIVALAWFGVNLLNVGLHSYGFTDNVATNLFIFIFCEIILITSCYVYIFFKNRKVTLVK